MIVKPVTDSEKATFTLKAPVTVPEAVVSTTAGTLEPLMVQVIDRATVVHPSVTLRAAV